MERTEPNADQIAQFSAKHRPPEWDKAGVQREAELRMDDTAVQAAMKFWPPE
jgi:hypothetical protein